ncbi:MAG: rRNA ((967)-C(5))-methyltransferase [Verrucomicrobiaceae bacterium]|nr:rRNA ((967)-C(5))-methyltransferase [Verrucomicrobiaceae bacterium]
MPSSRQLAHELLQEWNRGEQYASALLDEAVVSNRLEPRDAALLQTIVLGCLRNLSLLDHWIDGLTDGKHLEREAEWILRSGLAQLLILNMPPHAVVNETVGLAGRARGLVNAVLRRADREREAIMTERPTLPPWTAYSHPDFLVQRWTRQFGAAEAKAICAWDQEPSSVYVRINELLPGALQTVQQSPGLEDIGDGFFACDSLPRAALAAGACYAQDPSTAAAPRLLAPLPGETVLDACAAPGGKTALMAQLMGNQGTIIATDSSSARIRRLDGNLKRLRVANTTIHQYDWSKGGAYPWDSLLFDRILLDVPCSNTGVMRRRVDVRWRLKLEEFKQVAALQLQLIKAVMPVLKPGGTLVYSTCSLDAEENEQVVQKALAEFPSLRLEETKQVLPQRDGFDGAYTARLVLG